MSNGLTKKELKKAIKKVKKDIATEYAFIDRHINKIQSLEFVKDTLLFELEMGLSPMKRKGTNEA